MAEALRINGVDVVECGYVLLPDLSSIGTAPGKRTGDIVVAQRHGAVRTPHKRYEAHTFPLTLWIRGIEPGGGVPADPDDQFFENYDSIMRMLVGVLALEHQLPDDSVWQLDAEVLAQVDHTRYEWVATGSIGLSLTATYPFWRSEGPVVAEISSSGSPTVEALSEFAPSTAPIDDAVVVFNGPASNPRLTVGDFFVQYNRVLTGGQSVTINVGTWSISTVGVVLDYGSLVHAGLGAWLEIEPASLGGGPSATYDHDGVSPSLCTVTARNSRLGG